uniref:Uncharacterized protein n=1 Tax=Aureoumbra lagunensis TaxID=44058 RepID=A0A7S3JZW4_9STRA
MTACPTACGEQQQVRKERFANCKSLGEATSSSSFPRFEENEILPEERILRRVRGGECDAQSQFWRWEEPIVVPQEFEDGSGGDESPGFSGTNIQEELVDEADTVKSSGNILYLASRTVPLSHSELSTTTKCEYRLSIVRDDDSGGDSLQLLASVPLGPLLTTPKEMLIRGNVLLLIGSASLEFDTTSQEERTAYYYNYQDAVVILWFDVSDPTLPRLVRRQIREGYYISGRLIQDTAYLVISRQSWYANSGPWLVPYYRDEIFDQYLDLNQSALLPEEISIDLWQQFAARIPLTNACDCTDIAYAWPMNSELGEFSSVLAISLASVDEATTVPVASDTVATRADRILYASTRAIYLTQQQYLGWNWWRGVDEISSEEDEWDAPQVRTFVLKFEVDAQSVHYSTSFDVPGELVEQFAVSETSDGTKIRFATTARAINNWESVSSGLFVYDAHNGSELGSLTHLAPGESIFAARFLGDGICYLVTFVRTDPLYAIAFESEGTTPIVLDELKIRGFSNYLHPILSIDRVIGLGHDVLELETGGIVTAGLQLSLFDVANNDLARLDLYTIGDTGSFSIATSDHRAFFYDTDSHVLAFPLTLATLDARTEFFPEEVIQPWTQGLVNFQGAFFFKIDDSQNSFSYLGNVTHFVDPDFFTPRWVPYDWVIEGEEEETAGYWDTYFNTYDSGYHISRIFRRGDNLFTVSDSAILKSSFPDLDQISRLELHDTASLAQLFWLGNPFEPVPEI